MIYASNYVLWQNRTSGERGFWSLNGTNYQNDWIPLPTVTGDWNIAATADFNADGLPDIVWQNDGGQVTIWLMNGTTWGGQYGIVGTVPAGWKLAAAADMTGDRMPDLVWENTSSGPNSGQRGIWVMNGTTFTGEWRPLYASAVSTNWDIAGVKDMTGDGQPDLVWQNTVTGDRGVWPMNRTTWNGVWVPLPAIGSQWDIAAVADVNGDDRADLTWQNIVTGDRGFWPLEGTSWNGQWIPLSTVPTQWNIADVMSGTVDRCSVTTLFTTPSSVDGALSSADCRWGPRGQDFRIDYYATHLSSTQAIQFDEKRFDAWLYLTDPNGTLLAENDQGDGSVGDDSRIRVLLPAGDYVLGASEYVRGQTAAYTLAAALIAQSNENCAEWFIARGVTTSQNLAATDCHDTFGGSTTRDDDRFTIYLTAGVPVTIIATVGTMPDTYLRLYSGPTIVAFNDDYSGGGFSSRIVYTPTTSGYYVINVTSFYANTDARSHGTYTLNVQ
jgi:hypothetical protein